MSNNEKAACYCRTDSLNTLYSIIWDICVFEARHSVRGFYFKQTTELHCPFPAPAINTFLPSARQSSIMALSKTTLDTISPRWLPLQPEIWFRRLFKKCFWGFNCYKASTVKMSLWIHHCPLFCLFVCFSNKIKASNWENKHIDFLQNINYFQSYTKL